jgi:hypothetical protein
MSEVNTPQRIGMTEATQAINSLIAPDEDTAEQIDAPDEVLEHQDGVEMAESESEEDVSETLEAESEEEDDQEDDSEDTSYDLEKLLQVQLEVNGEEKTVEELRKGYLRTSDYTRKTTALADRNRSLDAEYQKVSEERAQYLQMLPVLAEQLKQEQPEPDWDTLFNMDPKSARIAETNYRKEKQLKAEQLESIKQENERVAKLESQRVEYLNSQYLDRQRELLPDLIPQWRDSTVAQKESTELRSFLLNEGFDESAINSLQDASLVKLARKAMLYDQGANKVSEAKATPKKQKVKTLRSGSRGSQPIPKTELKRAQQRLQQSGRVSDAAEMIKNLKL